MRRLRKYYAGFRLALITELTYRMNFVFGFMRQIVVFVTAIFLFRNLPHGAGEYSTDALVSYAVISFLVSSVVFAYVMPAVSAEIKEGNLSNYLTRPIHYLSYWAARLCATRLLLVVIYAIGFIGAALYFKDTLLSRISLSHIVPAIGLLVGACVLIQIIDFLGALTTIWTDDPSGPQWLIFITIQLMSGSLIPIDIMPQPVQQVIALTPLPSLVFAPVKTALGQFSAAEIQHAFMLQLTWIAVLGIVLAIVWKRGLNRYEAYGR